MVASSMSGRKTLADRALVRLNQSAKALEPSAIADLWRRGLAARTMRDQFNPLKAGADRNASLLRPLLESAVERFAEASPIRAARRHTMRSAELDRHRAACLSALGREREADEVSARTFQPDEDAPIGPERRKAA
jgi:hypothetical protein